jgi:subtilisin-like proprotein convertase family protein
MKKQIGILLLVLTTLMGRAQVSNLTVNVTNNYTIPDANPAGVTSSLTVSGMAPGWATTNLTVSLNISGGFNGDLYVSLLSPNGTMVVLLNRVGMSSANAFGYSDAGFNITLAAAGYNNVHNYQSYSPTFSSGQLTGTWAPDQRAISPDSDPSLFDAAPTGNNFNAYYGNDPNGVWTLFAADLSGGGEATLVSWGLTISTVPEPTTTALLGGGLAALWWMNRKHRK